MKTLRRFIQLKVGMIFNVFCQILQLLNLRVVSDPDRCRENYTIFFYHFYMIICLVEWFSNGENYMLIALPVFEI